MKKILLILFLLSLSLNAQIIIKHTAYEIHLDTILKEPTYTHYILTPTMTVKKFLRSSFTFDPLVAKKYQGSGFGSFDGKYGYDRGHLAPDVDFTALQVTENEAMYYDNTADQNSKLNRGTWKSLESYVHELGKKQNVEVWTGCVYKGSVTKFNGLVVPLFYWKLIKYSGKTEAYKMPNTTPQFKDFKKYKVNEIEILNLIQ